MAAELINPTVLTDRTTYSQGDVIQYTGAGFTPGSQVTPCLSTDSTHFVCLGAPYAIADPAPIWSTGFESGTQNNFNYPDTGSPCGGNAPGQVVTTKKQSGVYAGYFTSGTAPHPQDGSGVCRSYSSIQFGNCAYCTMDHPITRDFYVQVSVYVPSSVTLNASSNNWQSFMTIDLGTSPDGADQAIRIDSLRADRYQYICEGFVGNFCSEPVPAVLQWPFDTWFTVGVEVHLRQYPALSTIILYQDGTAVQTVTDQLDYASWVPTIDHLHFGLYTSNAQSNFAFYNDNIALYDLTAYTNSTGGFATTGFNQGSISGSMQVGFNIPSGTQLFWVEDLSSNTNSNVIQLTILPGTVTVTATSHKIHERACR